MCEGISQSQIYIPKPDLVKANRVRDHNEFLSLPSHNITTMDEKRMKEVDNFYKLAQMQRKQYKDHTGCLHPLEFFKEDEYAYQCAPGLLRSYLFKYPESYIQYKVPLVLPLTYERRMKTPYIPDLSSSGIYTRGNCIAFKR